MILNEFVKLWGEGAIFVAFLALFTRIVMAKDKVISHLKGDIKTFKKEAKEDRELMKSLKHKKHEHEESKKHEKKKHKKKDPKKHGSEKKTEGRSKIKKVMHEFKEGELHSGSKKGPVVTNPRQALAISISEARKSGAKIPKNKK